MCYIHDIWILGIRQRSERPKVHQPDNYLISAFSSSHCLRKGRLFLCAVDDPAAGCCAGSMPGVLGICCPGCCNCSPPVNALNAVVRGVIGFSLPCGVFGVLGKFKKICLLRSHFSSCDRPLSGSFAAQACFSSMSVWRSASRSVFSAFVGMVETIE